MKDVKTRPKTWNVQVRHAAAFAPKELSKLMKENAKSRLFHQSEPGANFKAQSGATNDATAELEASAQSLGTNTVRHAHQGGKQLA